MYVTSGYTQTFLIKKKEQENDFPKHACSSSTWKANQKNWEVVVIYQLCVWCKVQGQSEVYNKQSSFLSH